MENEICELEKEALLNRESFKTVSGKSDLSTMNNSVVVGKGDHHGQMSIRELRREDQAQIDDLGDQMKTKEDEIQILWNVIKEINKLKGGNQINVSQL